MVYQATPTKQEEVFKQSRAVTGSSILAQQQAIRGAPQSLILQVLSGNGRPKRKSGQSSSD